MDLGRCSGVAAGNRGAAILLEW
ncbi:hypothetical protein NC652_025704 [Populus alba x Populus x berolinensis]|nr:hypothetical protein NC652_025704 [Populus alba x Populus x berolinensis]